MKRIPKWIIPIIQGLIWVAPCAAQDAPRAEALFSFVVQTMEDDHGLLPSFRTTTVAGMRGDVFGDYEKDRGELEFVESVWGVPHEWMSPGLTINFDYHRFLSLPPDLPVSYSFRAACPAEPFFETERFVAVIQGHSIPYEMVEIFAYYYYLERALAHSMGSDSPMNAARRERMLAYAETFLVRDWQTLSYDETWEATTEFSEFVQGEILNFSHNDYAFRLAERGMPTTFVYLETWECGGYEGNSYFIGATNSNSRIMIISDLEYEICRALDFDPWSPEECSAWQSFPREDMLAVGWFRVLSFDDNGSVRRGSIRPQTTALQNRDWSQPLVIEVDTALQ